MSKLALQLPGFGRINNPPELKFSGDSANLGSIISGFLNIALYIAGFLAFYYLIWGTFQYILASGSKEDLAKARHRITWALVGLLVVFSSFLIAKYASEIFPASVGGAPF